MAVVLSVKPVLPGGLLGQPVTGSTYLILHSVSPSCRMVVVLSVKPVPDCVTGWPIGTTCDWINLPYATYSVSLPSCYMAVVPSVKPVRLCVGVKDYWEA